MSTTGKRPLFFVTCTTCQARIKVLNHSAVGEIHSCPKCGSMVQLSPPPGWQPGQTVEPETASQPEAQLQTKQPAPHSLPPLEQPAEIPRYQKILLGVVSVGAAGLAIWVLGYIVITLNREPTVTPIALEEASVENESTEAETSSSSEPDAMPSVEQLETIAPEEKTESEPIPASLESAEPSVATEVVTTEPEETPTPTKPANPQQMSLDEFLEKQQETPTDPTMETAEQPSGPRVSFPLMPTLPEQQQAEAEEAGDAETIQLLTREEVEQRLSFAVVGLKFRQVPLIDAVETLSAMGGVASTFDLPAMTELGVPLDTPVSLQVKGETIAEALTQLLEEQRLGYDIRSGQLVVTSRDLIETELQQQTYMVEDLLPSGSNGTPLVEWLKGFLAPNSWQNDPEVSMELSGIQLLVTHRPAVHRELVETLAKLRLSRDTTAVDLEMKKNFPLTPRLQQASDALLKPLRINFSAVPFKRIVEYIQEKTEFRVLVDTVALAKLGLTPDAEANIHTQQPQPLAEVLIQLLSPLECAYVVVDAKTILITTQQALQTRTEIEVYPLRSLQLSDQQRQAILGRLRARIFPETWFPTGDASLAWDEPSQTLFVRNHQPAQAQILQLFEQEEAARSAESTALSEASVPQ
ncbi:Hypothetical protein PBC10988_24840 [Planctomycetales bacterium 10988]|nr:Hypothetical protein PBC10988_24840 [Planctomycetales bacterium 10988]